MELKQIKELMAAMGRTGTKRLTIRKEGFELELEREERGLYKIPEGSDLGVESFFDENLASRRINLALSKGAELSSSTISSAPIKENDNSSYINSPMVGTFYSSPSPDDAPFVKVGEKVDKNTVVCIIEAMKVMNEVKAGVSGTIVEALVESGNPVEFGSKLFRITPHS